MIEGKTVSVDGNNLLIECDNLHGAIVGKSCVVFDGHPGVKIKALLLTIDEKDRVISDMQDTIDHLIKHNINSMVEQNENK